MKWRKLGRVFDPTDAAAWMRTHAALPIPRHLDGDRFLVYCSGRDDQGRAQIGSVEIEVGESPRLIAVNPEPIVRFGELGTYDDRGILTSSLVENGDKLVLYTTGVNLGVTVPFYYAVGAAISLDGGVTWQKYTDGPILDRNTVDPILTASPYVLIENGTWRMWYMSGAKWTLEDGKPKHYYHLRYCESKDGLRWNRAGRIAIDFAVGEYAISRPNIVRDPGCYRMWFASRGDAYRLRYAESEDGFAWRREEGLAGIDVTLGEWDSDMLCYPYVFDHAGKRYMLYNGNAYGRTGFGLAILESAT